MYLVLAMASRNLNDFDRAPIESAATQAKKVLVETTTDTNTLPTFFGGPDTPADEMALSIDHFREQLFSLLTPEDLFKCRRLNRVWNSYATFELQEQVKLNCWSKKKTLKEYLTLLQKHEEMFPALPLPVFRKHSFGKYTYNILSDPKLQQFLKAYGYLIRDLSLYQYNRDCTFDMPEEKDVIEQVRNLLILSAPNLTSLRIYGMDLRAAWRKSSSDPDQNSRPLRITDPEFEEIHSIPDTEKNENLKIFSFNSMSGKMFELAIQLAPNLEEIQIQSDEENQEYRYFIEPINRLWLCKDVQYSVSRGDPNVFNNFVELAHEGNLKIRDLSFMFGSEEPYIYFGRSFMYFCARYVADDVDAVNKLLACSWDSLETVEWRWVKAVRELEWPEVMPNVWKISLGPLRRLPGYELHAFTPDFSWEKTFPSLRHLEIPQAVESGGFGLLLRCFNRQCIASVKEVHVLEDYSEEGDAVALENLEQLCTLFPSAQVISTRPVPYVEPNTDLDWSFN